jgi:hypothetical protein
LVSLVDGSRKKLAENFTGSVYRRPKLNLQLFIKKRFVVVFVRCATCHFYPVSDNLDVNFYNEMTDVPDVPVVMDLVDG